MQSLGVAFTGGNYLVTWSDSVGLNESNVYGRLVTAAGIGSGGRISIAGATGQQIGANVSALNGNFLVTWLNQDPDPANSTVQGRLPDVGRCAHGYGAHSVYHRRRETADQLRSGDQRQPCSLPDQSPSREPIPKACRTCKTSTFTVRCGASLHKQRLYEGTKIREVHRPGF
jgi:hypothetical protein